MQFHMCCILRQTYETLFPTLLRWRSGWHIRSTHVVAHLHSRIKGLLALFVIMLQSIRAFLPVGTPLWTSIPIIIAAKLASPFDFSSVLASQARLYRHLIVTLPSKKYDWQKAL